MQPVSNILPPELPAKTAEVLGRLHALATLSIVSFSGLDALPFLQGQLTNDIAGAATTDARLAGYCTAQGRLLGSGVFFTGAPEVDGAATVFAMMRADIVSSVMKRLSMFVLRAKVSISPASDMTVTGVTCPVGNLDALNGHVKVSLPIKPYQLCQSEFGYWICAPSATEKTLRWWWVADTEQRGRAQQLIDQLQPDSERSWALGDLAAGLPWIEALTKDLFIPQTVNLDLIEGVSFTKGCYPGQEIVARSHYRGTLKRRMAYGFVQHSASSLMDGTDTAGPLAINAGDDVINTLDDNQACGRVINVVQDGQRTYLLFEAPFSVMDSDSLAVAAYPGLKLEQLALPYPINTQ